MCQLSALALDTERALLQDNQPIESNCDFVRITILYTISIFNHSLLGAAIPKEKFH